MKNSDINLYVIRQNFTTKDMLQNFNDTITRSNEININLIINDISNNKFSYGYGYGYGETYGYGYGYYSNNSNEIKKWWNKI